MAIKLNKKIIFSIIIVLILIAGGFFWWWQGREIKGSPEDYVIKETEEGKIVENKKAGLTVKVPERWETERVKDEEGVMVFYSPETEMERREEKIVLPIEKGCVVRTTVVYREGDFDRIKRETRRDHLLMGGVKYDEFEEITINNFYAIKNTFELEKFGSGISVYIPIKNKVYGFHLVWASGEKEKCVQEFDKFLETVSIK